MYEDLPTSVSALLHTELLFPSRVFLVYRGPEPREHRMQSIRSSGIYPERLRTNEEQVSDHSHTHARFTLGFIYVLFLPLESHSI
jgi:hypothetical protein